MNEKIEKIKPLEPVWLWRRQNIHAERHLTRVAGGNAASSRAGA